MRIWRMRNACWITMATDTPSEYVILTAFARQQWLHERASLLRYAYTTYPVYFTILCLRMLIWDVFATKRIRYCPSLWSD